VASAAVVTAVMPTASAAMAAHVPIASADAVASATIAASTAVTAVAGDSLIFTAQQGDADDREKDRDAQHNSSVHPRILHT
jgi:hypothetical protein